MATDVWWPRRVVKPTLQCAPTNSIMEEEEGLSEALAVRFQQPAFRLAGRRPRRRSHPVTLGPSLQLILINKVLKSDISPIISSQPTPQRWDMGGLVPRRAPPHQLFSFFFHVF